MDSSANFLADALDGDRTVYGVNVLSCSPAMIEALSGVGLDYVWIDLEHTGPSPYDSSALARLARAASVADLELIVRIPEADPKMINKVIDGGIRTVLVPRVDSAAAVERAVRASRFEHDGEPGNRGAPLARSTGWRGADNDFVEQADDAVVVGAMIETRGALENLDEIMSVPGLAFAFVGPGDISISLGHPLRSNHESVTAAVDDIKAAASRQDVPLGRIATTSEAIEEAMSDGYRVLRIGVDTVAVAETLERRLRDISDQ